MIPSDAPAVAATTMLGVLLLNAILLNPIPANDRVPVVSDEISAHVPPAFAERRIPNP